MEYLVCLDWGLCVECYRYWKLKKGGEMARNTMGNKEVDECAGSIVLCTIPKVAR